MYIFVASSNPVKINAVITAASETWPEVVVKGFEVESGVSEQPMSDDETRIGSENRAKAVLEIALNQLQKDPLDVIEEIDFPQDKSQILAVGLEGGVFEKKKGVLWSTVWATVMDADGNIHQSNGARFRVPDIVAKKILAGGEMGPIIGELYSDPELKKKGGLIGAVTKQFIDRTEEYKGIVKLALGLWYGRDWQKDI